MLSLSKKSKELAFGVKTFVPLTSKVRSVKLIFKSDEIMEKSFKPSSAFLKSRLCALTDSIILIVDLNPKRSDGFDSSNFKIVDFKS